MGDSYAPPAFDVLQRPGSEPGGDNVEDAIDGNIEVNMLETIVLPVSMPFVGRG